MLFIVIAIADDGPLASESPSEFNDRIQRAYQHYLAQRDVVGRLQERLQVCTMASLTYTMLTINQSGNDPGDDEDGSGGEDQRPGLRGRGEVRLKPI